MHFNILWCEHSINATLSRYCERFCIETVMHWICTKSAEEALVLVIEHQLFDSMFVHIGAESQPWDHLNGTNPTLNKSRCRPFAYICTDIKCLHTIAIVIFHLRYWQIHWINKCVAPQSSIWEYRRIPSFCVLIEAEKVRKYHPTSSNHICRITFIFFCVWFESMYRK